MSADFRTTLRPPSHPDQIIRPQRTTVGQFDIDAGAILSDTRDLTSVINRNAQFVDPAGQYALDVVLPQRKPVRVPSGKVADVQRNLRKPRDLRYLALR
jgi:hypothetical protein